MNSLIVLKARKKAIESFLRSNNALKTVASVRLSKYKTLASIAQISYDILPTSNFYVKKNSKQEINSLNVIIGCDQGMCGNFYNSILTCLRFYLMHNENIFVIGKKFASLVSLRSNVILKNLDLSNDGIYKLVNDICDYLDQNKVTTLILHYYHGNKVIKDIVFMSRDVNKLIDMHDKIYLIIVLQRALFRSALSENRERIINLEQANINAEGMQKKIINQLNRVRQEKITNSLNESIAGVL